MEPEENRPHIAPANGPDFDLAIIGGGVNGAGVARDAALRGLKVVLFEKEDLAHGATGNSSGLIHGGPRYMLKNPAVTRLSCVDSGYIQSIAPHLLFRIPFILPVPRSRPLARVFLELTEAFFSAYDRYQPYKNGLPHGRLNAEQLRRIEPGIHSDVLGAVTFDEWGINPWRLVASNALDAARHGAQIHTHTAVERFLRGPGGQVQGLRVRDSETGLVRDVSASVVLNATGAWSPGVAALANSSVRLRPGKGVHIVLDRRITNYALVSTAIDGREIFVFPHEDTTWIGTTDDDFFGDPDDLQVHNDEIEYLITGIEGIFPGIRRHGQLRTMVGLRPSLHQHGVNESAIPRAHAIYEHPEAPGLLSLCGGKLASYRAMAEEATDHICSMLNRRDPCRTHRQALPGGEQLVPAQPLAAKLSLPISIPHRLLQRQGTIGQRLLEQAQETPTLVCDCECVTDLEIRHVVRHEWVRDLCDLERRTRCGSGPCLGSRCTLRAAQIVGEERGLDGPRINQLVRRYVQHQWKVASPVANGTGLARLQLLRSITGEDS